MSILRQIKRHSTVGFATAEGERDRHMGRAERGREMARRAAARARGIDLPARSPAIASPSIPRPGGRPKPRNLRWLLLYKRDGRRRRAARRVARRAAAKVQP